MTINHYAQIDLIGFVRLSDALGGVPVNLCHAVDDTHARNVAEGGDGGSGFEASKGHHRLRGLRALEFVRQRYNYPDGRGDLDRVRRQQYFLTAAFRQVASVGVLTKLHALGGAIKRSLYLDDTLDLVELGEQLAQLSANSIVSKTIPSKFGDVDGISVLLVSPTKVRAFVESLVNPPTPTPGSSGSPSATRTPKPIDSKCIE